MKSKGKFTAKCWGLGWHHPNVVCHGYEEVKWFGLFGLCPTCNYLSGHFPVSHLLPPSLYVEGPFAIRLSNHPVA